MLEDYLLAEAKPRQLGEQLYSVLPADEAGAHYDRRAQMYDRLVTSPLYLRLAWGIAADSQSRFIARAFGSRADGALLDVAAGSCVSSVSAYAETSRPVIVLDRSVAMLRQGLVRLKETCGGLPDNVWFVQADALALPFRPAQFTTVLCHGALHLLPDVERAIGEWRRVVTPGGSVAASSLVRGRAIGDRYLALLHRSGEISPPRTLEKVEQLVKIGLGCDVVARREGNFAYLESEARE